MSVDRSILDAHVTLRLNALADHRAFVPGPAAEAAVRARLEPAHLHGTVRALEDAGALRAVLTWRHRDDAWYGEPVTSVDIDHSTREEDAALIGRWLSEVLATELPRMQADLDLTLDRGYACAYRALREHGVGIDSVILLGSVGPALERLRADATIRPFPPGLRLRPMTVAHVEGALRLHRETFADTPQFCFFGANPSYLEGMRERLVEELTTDERHLQRVLLRGETLVGHVSATVDQSNAFWGPCAGMSLVLDPGVRGQGLLRPLYERLLAEALERGAVTFKGGTSQGPVLRLARRMGRPLYAATMRRERFFDEAHFGSFVPR